LAGLALYYFNPYHKLTFQLAGASISSISLTEAQANFVIQISNPEALPVYIPSGSFRAYVNSQHLGKGTFGSRTISRGQANITVPVFFSASSILQYSMASSSAAEQLTSPCRAQPTWYCSAIPSTPHSTTPNSSQRQVKEHQVLCKPISEQPCATKQ
jgi:hypothetical protein